MTKVPSFEHPVYLVFMHALLLKKTMELFLYLILVYKKGQLWRKISTESSNNHHGRFDAASLSSCATKTKNQFDLR